MRSGLSGPNLPLLLMRRAMIHAEDVKEGGKGGEHSIEVSKLSTAQPTHRSTAEAQAACAQVSHGTPSKQGAQFWKAPSK